MQQPRNKKRRDWIDYLILIILALSFVCGLYLRTYRMNWDGGHYYHPDERALAYYAIGSISLPLPPDVAKLLKPDSPLNPHFFNYGNLPMYLIRAGSHVLSFVIKNAWRNENLWMAGRGLSALFDMATILLSFLIGRKLYGRRVGALATVLGCFTVLQLQLSHFLTVDTFLTTFIALGMYFAIGIVRKGSLVSGLAMGIALGLAMGTKVSVAPLLVSVIVAWLLWAWRGSSDPLVRQRERLTTGDRAAKAILGVLLAVIAAGLFFVITMPYAIIDWTSFIRSVDEQSRMVRGIADYPYTRQYLNTPVFLYQIWNTSAWGMGLPYGIVAYVGLALITIRTIVKRRSEEIVLLSWVLVYFFINGIFQVKFLRYMLPLFPFLAIMASEFLWQLWDWAGRQHALNWRSWLRVPLAQAKERDDEYLELDAEAEDWEREKARQAGLLPKPVRRPAPARRRGRQLSVAAMPSPQELAPSAGQEPAPKVELTAAAPVPAEAVAPADAIAPVQPAAPLELAPAVGGIAETAGLAPLSPAEDLSAEAGEPVALGAPQPVLVEHGAEETLPAVAEEQAASAAPEAVATLAVSAPSLHTVLSSVRAWTGVQRAVALLMGFVVFSTVFYAVAFLNIYNQRHPWEAISEWIYRNVPAGSTMGIEHWDDALPLGMNIDGLHRSFEEYKHTEFKNYEDDNQAKLDMLVSNIQKSDYIVLATNRLYGTIARLPERYPITSRYYELLFAEKLGFQLVAMQRVYPSLAGVTIMDNTLADPALPRPPLWKATLPKGLVIDLGRADESFTVYDHPMPLIFKKVEQIPEAQLREVFSGTLQAAQDYQNKRQARSAGRPAATASAKTFLMTDAERTAQEAGGTFVALFNPDNLTNRLPVVFWWLALQLLALISFPIGFLVFGNLRDRGYGIHKTLGLLLVAYLPWLTASLKLVPFGRLSIMLSMLVVALLSALILRSRREQITAWVRANLWLIAASEIVFTLAFLSFVLIRMLNPDLWQPWNGGEKPMEFAYLSAIARSTYFPPYDPFFAGGYINYYYYGQYVGAMVTRLLGIMPSVAFNLIIPSLFALTVINSFSITYNLVAGIRKIAQNVHLISPREFLESHRSLLAWALVGALFVTVIGNLSTVGEVLRGPYNRGQTTIRSTLPGVATTAKVIDGIVKGLKPGQRVLDSFNYWNPSRVIPETINEFPFWSYLFADLHPHTIGIPFTLLILGLALSLLAERRPRRQRPILAAAEGGQPSARPPAVNRILDWIQDRLSGIQPDDVLNLLVMGLAVGSLGAINTWDLPTYFGVVLCVALLRSWIDTKRFDLVEAIGRFAVIALLSLLLYLPFYMKYSALTSGIGLVRSRTPIGYYLAVSGFFIFAIISFMVVEFAAQRRGASTRLARLFWRYYDRLPVAVHRLRLLTEPRDTLKIAVYVTTLLAAVLLVLAVARQWTLVLLVPLLILSVVIAARGDREPERVFAWLLAFTGLLLSLGIEIFFLRDWLQGGSSYRMNTLFKFGIQIWVFFALASAVGLSVATQRIRLYAGRLKILPALWYLALAAMTIIVFMFPVFGIPARVNDRFPGTRPPVGTLDGTAFMSVGKYTFDWERKNIAVDLAPDYAAIQWLLRNVEGSPVIAEAALPYYRELGARISAYTGLPTLVGVQHEQEQRPGDTQVGPRQNEVSTLYNETSFEKIIPILQKNRVRYIYVGQLEQALYAAAGLAKFDQAVGPYLTLVYDQAKVKIFEVRDF